MFSEDVGAYTHSIYNNFTEIVGCSNSSPLSMEEYILLRKQAVCELEQEFAIRDSNNKVIPIGSSEVGTNVHATSARTPSARYVRHESGNLVPIMRQTSSLLRPVAYQTNQRQLQMRLQF